MPFPSIAYHIRSLLRSVGLDIALFPRLGTMEFHFRRSNADVLIDAGANRGQYGSMARRWGFRGRIISFEPVDSAFQSLRQKCSADGNWTAHQLALGAADTTGIIHVARDTTLSSLLQNDAMMSRAHAAPGTLAAEQPITIRRLDGMVQELGLAGKSLWLKTDTQGYDLNVLLGAEGLLPQIQSIQMELSTRPLYKDQPLIETVIAQLRQRGYYPADMILGGRDQDGLIEVDGIFTKSR